MLQEINKELLIYINSFWNNYIIEKIVYIFVDAPIFFLPIFLLTTWIYYSISNKEEIKQKENLLFIFYWVIIAISASLIIQQLIHIDRPETVVEATWKLLLKHIPDASFPSDHATVSFAFLAWLYLWKYKKIFYIFLVFVLLMNLSRVVAWVHWPFDILAWFLVWIIWSIISFKILKNSKLVKKLNKYIIKILNIIKL
jgi:undecaprenyl-diphosphatase